jgi:hypothetical protein
MPELPLPGVKNSCGSLIGSFLSKDVTYEPGEIFVDVNRVGSRVEGACDLHLLASELLGFCLVVQCINFLCGSLI